MSTYKYRPTPHENNIEGLDLKIDPNTQKLCETYNQSSSDTRSVLYVLLIVSSLSLAAVFNSNSKVNWPGERIDYYRRYILNKESDVRQDVDSIYHFKAIHRPNSVLVYTNLRRSDSMSVVTYRSRLDALIKEDVADGDIVKLPIIGVQIDINDLASLSGAAICLLLFLLRFTLLREKSNCRIAMNSINERYTDNSDVKEFDTSSISDKGETAAYYLADVNFTRRRFHYNFLSMNEVFNLPHLDSSNNSIQDTWLGKFINTRLFYIFFAVYAYILFNDFCTYSDGLLLSPFHTFLIMIFSLFFFYMIFFLCEACINQKIFVYRLFFSFWSHNYTLDSANGYEVFRMPISKRLIICTGTLLLVWGASIGFSNIPDPGDPSKYQAIAELIKAIFFIK